MLHIDQLTLQIPGLSREEARRLADAVGALLAERLPPDAPPRHLGHLYLRLPLPAATSREQLAGLIADAILERVA